MSKLYSLISILTFAISLQVAAQAPKKSMSWQLIDKSGKVIAPASDYIQVNEFSNGLCAAQNKAKKWGYVNNQGLTVVPFIFDFAQAFTEGVAIVGKAGKKTGDERFGIVDYKGKELLPIQYQTVFKINKGLFVYGNRKLGLVDRTGQILVKATFDEILPNSYGDGLIPVRKGNLWGYLDEEGNIAIDYQYHKASPIIDGKALIVKNAQSTSITLIDKEGNKLQEFPYSDKKFDFKNAKLRKDGFIEILTCGSYDDLGQCERIMVGLKNQEGKDIFKAEFSAIPLFKDGTTLAQKESLRGLLRETGETLTPFDYYTIFPYQNGKALATVTGSRLVLIDEKGEELKSLGKHKISSLSEELIPAAKCQDCPTSETYPKWGYLNLKGEFAIDMKFESAKPFVEGLAPVQNKDGKWGFIDAEGSLLIPYQYTVVKNFNNNVAWVATQTE